MFNNSGTYTLQISEDSSEFTYYTFTPRLLCDLNKIVDNDDELIALLTQAHRSLGMLEGMINYVSELQILKNLLIKKEVLDSCKIDGINAPFYDIITNIKQNVKNSEKIQRYIKGLDISYGKPVSNKLLCELHEALITENDSNVIGKFRNKQVFIEPHVFTNTKNYNPTAPEDLKLVLTDLEQYMKRNDDSDSLIKTALIHYQFEIIHPFDSGNGRIGRILILLYLLQCKLLSLPILPLSKYLLLFKNEYFDRLRGTQFTGEYTGWVKFFLRMVLYAAEDSIKLADSFLAIRNKNISLINTLGKSAKNTFLVYNYIEQKPIVSVSELSKKLELSFNTAGVAVEALIRFGILKQTGEQSRHRTFVFDEFVKFFDDL